MGLSERDYYRDDEPGGFHLGGERTMVVNLLIANVAVYVVCMFISGLTTRLSLHGDLFTSARSLTQAWQLLTYGFVHSPISGSGAGIFHLLMNMFVLWMFGREVEAKYGRMEFLRLYLVAIVFSGVVWAVRQIVTGSAYSADPATVLGASGAVTTVVLLYCLNWPKRQILLMGLFAMPAWVMGMVLVGIDLLRSFERDSQIAWDCHLAGALFAIGYFHLGINFGHFLPTMKKSSWMKRRPNLRVHSPDDSYENLDEEADRVLDKVHREGEGSLTARERTVLEAYSRRMRQKHR